MPLYHRRTPGGATRTLHTAGDVPTCWTEFRSAESPFSRRRFDEGHAELTFSVSDVAPGVPIRPTDRSGRMGQRAQSADLTEELNASLTQDEPVRVLQPHLGVNLQSQGVRRDMLTAPRRDPKMLPHG